MPINKREYINLLNGSQILNFFSWSEVLIEKFNTLREMHLEYSKKCYYHYLYPKVDIKKDIEPVLVEIIRYCRSIDVECKYNIISKHTHEHGMYCEFFYKGYNITDLIDLQPGMKKFKYH